MENWWVKFLNEQFLFTLYLSDERALALDHRERGRTFAESRGAPPDSELVQVNCTVRRQCC